MIEEITVMLVDDEERFLKTTRKLLSRKGYQVITAASGEEALEKLGRQGVDVVVLDVKMPGMGGHATLHAIKRDWPFTEVILLTGHASVDSAVEGLRYGAYAFLLKPCDIDELDMRIEGAYEMRRERQKAARGASRPSGTS